jgi:hypothetical protein
MEIVRLTEADLHNIIKRTVNESLGNTIQIQLINGYFYPVDSLSKSILYDEYNLERIPENKFDVLTPRFVRDGYKLAVAGYTPKEKEFNRPKGSTIGGEPHQVKDPCAKCGYKTKGVCDSGECGKKCFRLFSNKAKH